MMFSKYSQAAERPAATNQTNNRQEAFCMSFLHHVEWKNTVVPSIYLISCMRFDDVRLIIIGRENMVVL